MNALGTTKKTLANIERHLSDRQSMGMAPVRDLRKFFHFAVDCLGCDMATLEAANRAGLFMDTGKGYEVVH